MFGIRNDKGELLHKSALAIDDPRAVQVADENEPVKDVFWLVENPDGSIYNFTPFYPGYKNAEPVEIGSEKYLAVEQKLKNDAEAVSARRAALHRILNRMIDDEMRRVPSIQL